MVARGVVKVVDETEVAHLHPAPPPPVAKQLGEVPPEEHPAAGEAFECIGAAEIDQ